MARTSQLPTVHHVHVSTEFTAFDEEYDKIGQYEVDNRQLQEIIAANRTQRPQISDFSNNTGLQNIHFQSDGSVV